MDEAAQSWVLLVLHWAKPEAQAEQAPKEAKVSEEACI